MSYLDFLQEYWSLLAVVVLPVAGYFTRKYASTYAKKTALKYIVIADKMAFDNADVKLAFVCHAAYKVLPLAIRTLVPEGVFIMLVTKLYAELKDLHESFVTTDTDVTDITNNK